MQIVRQAVWCEMSSLLQSAYTVSLYCHIALHRQAKILFFCIDAFHNGLTRGEKLLFLARLFFTPLHTKAAYMFSVHLLVLLISTLATF